MRYKSLDALRGIAALIVVIHHCLVTLPQWSNVMLQGAHDSLPAKLFGYPPLDLLWAGNAAVRVFFVLSGFVLALMLLHANPPSYPAFVVKRIFRIYLPYAVVVAMAMVLMTVTAPHVTPELSEWFNTTSWNHPVSSSVILDHALMFGRPEYNFIDNPIWSLVHEMRYSLIFPALFWLARRVDWRLMIGASWVISIAAAGAVGFTKGYWAVASLQYAFLFVSGAEMAIRRTALTEWFGNLPRLCRRLLFLTSLLLLSTHGLTHASIHAVRTFAYLAPDIGAVGLLTWLLGSPSAQRVLEWKPALWVGRISYSLYLSHLVLLLSVVSVFHRVIPIYIILIAIPPLALVTAQILYQLLEVPAIALGHYLAQRIDGKSAVRVQGPPETVRA